MVKRVVKGALYVFVVLGIGLLFPSVRTSLAEFYNVGESIVAKWVLGVWVIIIGLNGFNNYLKGERGWLFRGNAGGDGGGDGGGGDGGGDGGGGCGGGGD